MNGNLYAVSEEGEVVVVRASDSEDLKIVLELIDMIEQASKGTQPKVEVVYLDHGDANYIATTLNSIFARVTIGQNGNYVPAQARTFQNNALTQLTGASPTQNVYALALPRFNAILLAAPEGRFDDVITQMRDRVNDVRQAAVAGAEAVEAAQPLIEEDMAEVRSAWSLIQDRIETQCPAE